DVREGGCLGLEQVRSLGGSARETSAQLDVAAFEHLRVVRILNTHVVRRTDRCLAIQELPEVLPTRWLPREDVGHFDGEPSADEERLPFVHVPLVEAALYEFREAVSIRRVDVLTDCIVDRQGLLDFPYVFRYSDLFLHSFVQF